ncbi:MAG: hypothetical protein WBE48_22925 [Xanthobacteraceae bacterium]
MPLSAAKALTFATDREPDSRLPIYHLRALKTGHPQMTDESRVDHRADEPITLHRIMQEMIGEGLRERYKPPQKLSHELLVLLMQLNEQERREAAAAKCQLARS